MNRNEAAYYKPATVAEALQVAHRHHGHFRYLAGGTDVLVNRFQGNDPATCLIDLSGIEELREIRAEESRLHVGSLTTLEDLERHVMISSLFPSLAEAAHAAASPVIRKTATIGGNLLVENRCSFYNQSEWWREAVGYCLKCDGDICIATGGRKACFSRFVSDTVPVLISLDAHIEVRDLDSTENKALEKLYTGDGIQPRNLPATALITQVMIPFELKAKTVFKKLRPRQAVDFTSLTTALTLHEGGRWKLAIGGVDPGPVVLEGDSGMEREDMIREALKKCRVVDNDVYSRKYRRDMIRVFLEQSFDQILSPETTPV